jgi:GH24 family phage-related lysozyme (muramidase)
MKKRSYLDYDWTPVINFESGGRSYYDRVLKKASWPGGASGITIGIGADLGYMTVQEFDSHFLRYFNAGDAAKLKSTIGLKGEAAKNKLSSVRSVELSWENAMAAFVEWTLPKFWRLSNGLWPGLDQLAERAQIALVSIVFNRGASTRGSSRIEMLNIKPLVLKKDYLGIAAEIRSMKRLWIGKNLDGLLKRRDAEAEMVESCVS